jgi:hypothetical protein
LTVVVSPHLYVYDLSMLVLPAGLLSAIAVRNCGGWRDWLPPVLIAGVLFGSNLWILVAGRTGIQPGTVLLLATLGVVLETVRRADDPASTDGESSRAAIRPPGDRISTLELVPNGNADR